MVMQKRYGLDQVGGGWRSAHATANANAAAKETARHLRVQAAIKRQDVREGRIVEPDPSPVSIRPWGVDDAAYVLDSWANSYRRSPTTGPIEREIFNIEQRGRINRLVTRATCRVFIACDAQDTTKIRGWICFEAPTDEAGIPTLHYVCVHPSFQMQGIGSALVSLCRKTAKDANAHLWSTHETQPMRHIREKWNVLYNPYLLEVGVK